MSWPGEHQQGGQWGPPGGYGGPPPQYGAPHPPPQGPGGGLSPVMIAVLAIVMAAVLIIAVAVVVVSLREESGRAAPQPAPSPTAGSADDPEPEPADDPASSPAADEDLINDGWRKVRAAKQQLVYEVPGSEGWKADSPDSVRGWEDDETGEIKSMSGTAGYRDRLKCENRSLAELGTRVITDSNDTEAMSENLAVDWAIASYKTDKGEPVVTTRSLKPFSRNGLKGHHAVVDVKVKVHESGCDPATARVHAVGTPTPGGGKGTRALIIDVHTGVDDAVSEKTVNSIVASLRDRDHKVKG